MPIMQWRMLTQQSEFIAGYVKDINDPVLYFKTVYQEVGNDNYMNTAYVMLKYNPALKNLCRFLKSRLPHIVNRIKTELDHEEAERLLVLHEICYATHIANVTRKRQKLSTIK